MLIRIDHQDGMLPEMYWCKPVKQLDGVPSWMCLDFSDFGTQKPGAIVNAAWNSDEMVFDLRQQVNL